jgi:dCTP deaminase
MILSNHDIVEWLNNKKLKIEPLSYDTVRENGVDLRIGDEYATFIETEKTYDSHKPINDYMKINKLGISGAFKINPNERALLVTKEKIEMPDNLIAFCCLRSSYARMGLFIPPTVVDIGFSGQLTIEIIGGQLPIKLYENDRFLHLIFSKTITSGDKYSGVYLDQMGVTPTIIK